MTSLAARVASFWACALLVGCSGDHDLLAQKPNRPGPDGAIGDGASDSFPVTPRDTGTTVDVRDPEPVGPWVLTLMNGVVDVDAARFCFVPVVGGGEAPADEPPVPKDGSLPFGGRAVLSTLGADPATTDVHPYLVLGAVGANAGWSCRRILERSGFPVGPPDAGATDAADAMPVSGDATRDVAVADSASDASPVDAGTVGTDAGPSDAGAPWALALPVIPAGALREARSYLAIATGCSRSWAAVSGADGGGAGDGASAGDGAAASDGAGAGDGAGRSEGGDANPGLDAALVCGQGFGPTTLSMSIVRLSRKTDFAKMGFQTVNASAATGPASLMVSQKATATMLLFSDSLDLGQLAPRVQPSLVVRGELGVPLGTAVLEVQPPLGAGTFPTFRNNLGAVLSLSRIDEASLDARNNFTFVMLGARPGQYREGAAAFQVRLVENAPYVAGD